MGVITYIDTGVLISAKDGSSALSSIALSFLFDPLRDYVTSDYVRVELLPKCLFHKQREEQRFYDDFFNRCRIRVPSSDELLRLAIDEGGRTGISGIDAIHVACALAAGAEELITAEKRGKLIHQANGVKVISIRQAPDDLSIHTVSV